MDFKISELKESNGWKYKELSMNLDLGRQKEVKKVNVGDIIKFNNTFGVVRRISRVIESCNKKDVEEDFIITVELLNQDILCDSVEVYSSNISAVYKKN